MAEPPDLPGENFVSVIIIADGGHEFAISGKRNSRIRAPVVTESAEKLRGEMRRIRSTAAVAAKEELMAGGETAQNQGRRLIERLFHLSEGAGSSYAILNSALEQRHVARLRTP